METREKILEQASWERSVSEKRAFVRGAEWMLGHLWNKVADIKPADGQRVLYYDADKDLVGVAVFEEGYWLCSEQLIVSPTHWVQITKP